MAKQFKVGDKVKIRKSSEYFKENTSHNPQNVIGTVVEADRSCDHSLRVQWPYEKFNSYRVSDLKISKEAVEENLLADVSYEDEFNDSLEVDTTSENGVYFSSAQTVQLQKKQVKKLRKQLKAWLTEHQSV